MITINITYETITPESAEEGDYADCGFEVENEEVTFRDTNRSVHLGDKRKARYWVKALKTAKTVS